MRKVYASPDRAWAVAIADLGGLRPVRGRSRRQRAWLPALLFLQVLALPGLSVSAAPGGPASINVDPNAAGVGALLLVTGSGFEAAEHGQLVLSGAGESLGTFRANGSGRFRLRATVPIEAATGDQSLIARRAHDLVELARTPFTVTTLTTASPSPSPWPTDTGPLGSAAPSPSLSPSPSPVPTPASPGPSALPNPSAAPSPTPTPSQSSTPVPSAPISNAFYVSSSGDDAATGAIDSPWRTIQHAVGVIPAGATILVRGGSYAGFTISRSGTQSQPITVDSGRTTVVDIAGAHDVVLRGMTITGAPAQWGAGVRVESGAYRVTIEGNTIVTNRSFGIALVGVTAVTVRDDDISDNETGIEISGGGSGIDIVSNRIHDHTRMVVNTVGGSDDRGANAIVFYRTSGPTRVVGNQIWNNRAVSYDYGYDGGAFEIYAASGVWIEDNRVWNNQNVLETGTDGATCDRNAFVRNVGFGGARTAPAMGLILRCASNMLIANNSFRDLDRFVFDVNAAATAFGGAIDGLRVLNNAVERTHDKVYSIDSALPANVAIDHGVSWNSSGGYIAYVSGKGNTSSLATFRSWTGLEQAGQQADPGFRDGDANDLQMLASSVAIDSAVPVPGVTDAFTGAAPDVGRYEFGG